MCGVNKQKEVLLYSGCDKLHTVFHELMKTEKKVEEEVMRVRSPLRQTRGILMLFLSYCLEV